MTDTDGQLQAGVASTRGQLGPTVLLVLAAVSWGASTSTTVVALREFDALQLLLVEVAVSAIVLHAAAYTRRGRRPSRTAAVRRGRWLGLLEPGLAYLLVNLGLERTSAASGSLIEGLEAVAVAVLAVVVLGERLDRRVVVALALGAVGGGVLAVGEGTAGRASLGDAMVVGGVLAAALYSAMARRLFADDGIGADQS